MNTKALLIPPVLAFLALAFAPNAALAVEVTCEDKTGTCTLENEPFDSLECVCATGDEVGGAGGEDYAEMTEEELLAQCEIELMYCEMAVETGTTAGTTTGGPDLRPGTGSSTGAGDESTTSGAAGDDTTGSDVVGTTSGQPPGATSDQPTDTAGAPSTSTEAGSSGGETPASDDESSGCAVSRRGRLGPAGLLLGLFGLGSIARRRRTASQ